MARTRIVRRNQRSTSSLLSYRSPQNLALSPREIRYIRRQARQASVSRLQAQRESWEPTQPSPEEREHLCWVRRHNNLEDRRRARELRQQRETEYQEMLFSYWSWRDRLSPQEFAPFRSEHLIPMYLWSRDNFHSHDFSWTTFDSRRGMLRDILRQIAEISRLLSNPRELHRANGWDSVVSTTSRYRHNFLRNYVPIENPEDSGSDGSVMADYRNSQANHPWQRTNESDHFSDDSSFELEDVW